MKTSGWMIVWMVLPALVAGQGLELEEDIAPEDLPVFSSTKRISVRGLKGGMNLEMAEWAEDVVGKVEDAIGFRMPLKPTHPLSILFVHSDQDRRFRVVRQQRPFESGILQKLVVYNYQPAEREDVLEGMVALMLNRYAISKQPREARAQKLASVPDWLSVGCAQHLYATTRERNRKLVHGMWSRGEAPSVDKLVALQRLPAGRWPEKSASGLLVGWLTSHEDWRPMVHPLFDLLGEGELPSKEWISKRIKAAVMPVDMEKFWDLHLAGSAQTTSALAVDWDAQLASLRRLMIIEPATMGIPYPREAKPTLGWEELPSLREAEWFQALLMKLQYQVKFLARGQNDQFQKVVDGYDAYLVALARKGGRFRKGPSNKELGKLLATAHAGLREYEAGLRKRSAYLDKFER